MNMCGYIVDIGLFFFIKYTELCVYMETVYSGLCKQYPYLQELDSVIRYTFMYIYARSNGLLIEPFQQTWMNSIIVSNGKMVESYKDISYLGSMRGYKDPLYLDNVSQLHMLKYDDCYVYKNTSFELISMNIHNITTVQSPFFSIEYIDVDSDLSIPLDLPRNVFIDENEICSSVFLKRWFEYNIKDVTFNPNYLVKITDFCFNTCTLDASQYIVLSNSGFSVEKIK